jgi:ferredoxin
MKVQVDQSICTGCAVCSDTCPEVFEMGDDTLAKVKVDVVPPEGEEKVKEAASTCPVTCITVEE